jgi:hypothetical protein
MFSSNKQGDALLENNNFLRLNWQKNYSFTDFTKHLITFLKIYIYIYVLLTMFWNRPVANFFFSCLQNCISIKSPFDHVISQAKSAFQNKMVENILFGSAIF